MPVKRLWSNGDFRRLYVARAASMTGDMFVPVALAFGVLRLTDSPAALGIVLAASAAPKVLFILVGGAVADRLKPHRAMIWSDVVRAGSQGAVAFLLLWASPKSGTWSSSKLSTARAPRSSIPPRPR
jgi:hypothetical protein